MGLETSTLIAIGSAAASAAGSMIQANEANANAKRMAAARNEELRQFTEKQRKLDRMNTETFDERMKDYSKKGQDQTLANATDARTETITQAQGGPTTDIALSGSAPTVVKSEIAKRMVDAFDESKAKAQALGRLSGFNDQWFSNNLGLTDTARKIKTNNAFASSNAAMLPGLQDLAEAGAYRPSSGLGQALSGAGTLGGYYAGYKAGKG